MDRTKYRILVVEDNPGDFMLVEDYLSEFIQSPELIQVKNFQELISIIQKDLNSFDLILLDLSLPDISKENLTEEMKLVTSIVPIIILTGFSDLDFSIKSLALGFSDYLVKDVINSLILYKSVLYAIERHRYVKFLRESEKRYMDIFHLSPLPMFVFDAETLKFLDINEAAIQSYGYSRSEFLSMDIKDIRPSEELPKLEEALKIRSEKGKSFVFPDHFIHQKKNGERISVEIISNRIYFNKRQAIIVLATDVTERLKFLNEIQAQNKRLREIAWAQSHLVRAPLARLMGLVDLLELDKDADLEKIIGYIKTSALELDEIVKEIVIKTQSIE